VKLISLSATKAIYRIRCILGSGRRRRQSSRSDGHQSTTHLPTRHANHSNAPGPPVLAIRLRNTQMRRRRPASYSQECGICYSGSDRVAVKNWQRWCGAARVWP